MRPSPDAAPQRLLWFELAAFALALTAGLALCAVDLARPFAPGTVGLESVRHLPGPFSIRVESLDPASSAARAGVRAGDVLRVAAQQPAFRLRTLHAGDALPLVRAATGERIEPQAEPARRTAFSAQWAVMRVIFLLFTALLLAARRRDRSVRALALFLLSIGLMCDWWTYPPALAAAGLIVRVGSGALGFPALVEFVLDLARGTMPDAFARRMRAALPAVAVAYVLLVAAKNALLYAAGYYALAVDVAIGLCNAGFAVSAGVLLARYALRASERERQKAAWIALSFVVALAGGVTYLVAGVVVPGGTFWGDVGALGMIALPCGLAYAILRHRLLDITFAIDQAVAYGIATFALLVVFTGMDWVAKSALEGTPDKRTFVNLVAAAAVLFILKIVHQRVNHVVRTTLFRKRVLRMQRLRAFAKDLRFFVDPALLERELVSTLDETLDGCGCAHYVRDGTQLARAAGTQGTAETIDLNDAAILRIQSTASPVRTGDVRSNLRAAYAFPIIARGTLGGVVLLGTDDSLRSYAPDEVAAIQDVVNAAGDTYHVLRAYRAAERPPQAAFTTTP